MWAQVSSTLHLGDCLEVMARMDAGSVDAVVCDPPYGREFIGIERDADYFAIAKARIDAAEAELRLDL